VIAARVVLKNSGFYIRETINMTTCNDAELQPRKMLVETPDVTRFWGLYGVTP
jgi:hypothetical protein